MNNFANKYSDAKILVVSDGYGDANLVHGLLDEEYDHVKLSVDYVKYVEEFEGNRPEVLVLAFDRLEKAERYYLNLYRNSRMIGDVRHKTIVLCNKDEVKRAYTLCKQSQFDDYVLFWPLVHDTPRLSMSIFGAVDKLRDSSNLIPSIRDCVVDVRKLSELDDGISDLMSLGTKRFVESGREISRLKNEIGSFMTKLSSTNLLQSDEELLRSSKEIINEFSKLGQAIEPIGGWMVALRNNLQKQSGSIKAFSGLVSSIKPLVMVVDDDAMQQKIIGKIIAESGCETQNCMSGMDAIRFIRTKAPQIILMDIDLPDISGIEVTRKIKQNDLYANLPIVMITGHSEKSIVVESLKAGAVDFVVKPIDKATLLAKIKNYISRS